MSAKARQVPELVRCFACGNPSTGTSPLVYFMEREGRVIVHNTAPCDDAVDEYGERIYPDDDPDTPIPVCGHVECSEDWDPCPPLPDGFGSCSFCGEARPLDRLAFVRTDGTGHLFPTSIPADRDPGDQLVAVSRYTGLTLLLCRSGGCYERRKAVRHVRPDRDEVTRRAGANDQATADQARADALSADGWATISELEALWGVSTRTVRHLVKRLLAADSIESREAAARSGGNPRKEYRRVAR